MTWPSVVWAESHSILETLQTISCQVTQTGLPTDAVFLEEICPNIVNILPLDYRCNIEVQHFFFSAHSPAPCATITCNTKCAAENCSVCPNQVCQRYNISSLSSSGPCSCLWLQDDQVETTRTQWLKTDLVQDNRSNLLNWGGDDNWGMLSYTSENTSLAEIVLILTCSKMNCPFYLFIFTLASAEIQETETGAHSSSWREWVLQCSTYLF